MLGYLFKRLLHGIVSIIIVVGIVMLMVYSFLDKQSIFASDQVILKLSGNEKTVYKYQQWERYGYLDYIPYSEYVSGLLNDGIIDSDTATDATLGNTASDDSSTAKKYVQEFTTYYQNKGYTVERLNGSKKTKAYLIAYKDIPVFSRLLSYFGNIVSVESINYASGIAKEDRGITFTWFDPAYGGKVFSPAIMGNGTLHKYLLYFDNKFPFVHQNLFSINLGTSFSMSQGNDVFDYMTTPQGQVVKSTVNWPSGLVEEGVSADVHTATYVAGSLELGNNKDKFTDDYTSVTSKVTGLSMIQYSFIIGIISTVIAYFLGVPLGVLMARKKDKLADKIGTIYVVFIMAVPSLAYIFIFKGIGNGLFNLPTSFSPSETKWTMYVLPIVSLALPSVASLMRWIRRYMIDQMSSDYVKFARAGGLSDREIFNKHILKNAAIPIVQGIPGAILGALTGALITERVYNVPGTGKLLTNAINKVDNGVIVGVTLFYAVLSVISLILGDILMAMVDPRISFSKKGR